MFKICVQSSMFLQMFQVYNNLSLTVYPTVSKNQSPMLFISKHVYTLKCQKILILVAYAYGRTNKNAKGYSLRY